MSWVEHVRAKIAYNEWANEKVFAAAQKLTDDQLNEPRSGTSQGSLTGDFAHLAGVQIWWRSVAADANYIAPAEPSPEGVMAQLRELLATSSAEMLQLAGSVTGDTLVGRIKRERGAETHEWPQWQVIEHLLNHSTHHRAEIGQVLHSLGASPGDMDFIFFVRE